MGKKKEENILDYLSRGKEECFKHEYYGIAAEGRVRITTDTGVYEFPKTYLDKNYNQSDYKEVLLKDWNSTKRAMHDLDSVRIVRCCTDKEDLKAFGEAMLYLRDHPRDAQIYAAIYEKSKMVPFALQKYAYEEIKSAMKIAFVQAGNGSMNENISYEIAERIPNAFRKGWENVDFSKMNFTAINKRLTPMYSVGQPVENHGKIVRIFAECVKEHYYLRYEVEYHDSYWGRKILLEKEICPAHSVAV